MWYLGFASLEGLRIHLVQSTHVSVLKSCVVAGARHGFYMFTYVRLVMYTDTQFSVGKYLINRSEFSAQLDVLSNKCMHQ